MKQGEIWMANLNPTRGSEQAGFRPVLQKSKTIKEILFLNLVLKMGSKKDQKFLHFTFGLYLKKGACKKLEVSLAKI
jgi:hypothetical protein